jgi:hypothetical protein
VRGSRGLFVIVVVVAACSVLTGTARARDFPEVGRPPQLEVPKPGISEPEPSAKQQLEEGRDLRLFGIVMTSIAAATIVTGVALIGVGINIKNTGPPGGPPPNDLGPGFVLTYAGVAVSGGGALLLGVPGAACWIAGQLKINRAREALERGTVTGLTIGPGPVGSQGLSLRWRF